MGKLNDRQIRSLKQQAPLPDSFISDGGGLYLRVTASGAKLWLYRYKNQSKTSWLPLGHYPSISLAEARMKTAELTLMRKQGLDPAEEAERVKREAEEAEQALASRMTFQKLFDQWMGAEIRPGRQDRGADLERSFRKDVLPVLGHRPIEEIKRVDVGAVLGRITSRGALRLANRTKSELRQCFGYAISSGLLEHDPTDRIKPIGGKAVERDRFLSEAELRVLLTRLLNEDDKRLVRGIPAYLRHSIIVLLATCCRSGELITAKWADIDLKAGTWVVPETKNGRPHVVYLSPIAIKNLEALRVLADGHKYVLPACKEIVYPHLNPKIFSKAVRDRQQPPESKNVCQAHAPQALLLEGGRWTPHDLRRTGATVMGQLGVEPWVIERCLNHMEPNKIQRTYQRQDYAAEQKEAWGKLGEYLERLSSI